VPSGTTRIRPLLAANNAANLNLANTKFSTKSFLGDSTFAVSANNLLNLFVSEFVVRIRFAVQDSVRSMSPLIGVTAILGSLLVVPSLGIDI
jgi:hypothetical protein